MDGANALTGLSGQGHAAIDGGLSCRAAADRFGVSASSAIRWRQRALEHGQAVAKPRGGDRHWGRIEAHGRFIRDLIAEQGDMTLVEVQARLIERGAPVGIGTLHRFFVRHGITRKKDRAGDRARPYRRPEAASSLVRRPTRSGTGTSRIHRRKLDGDQHDPQPWSLRQGRAPADGFSARPPQDDHAGGGPAHDRDGRAYGARWPDQR